MEGGSKVATGPVLRRGQERVVLQRMLLKRGVRKLTGGVWRAVKERGAPGKRKNGQGRGGKKERDKLGSL